MNYDEMIRLLDKLAVNVYFSENIKIISYVIILKKQLLLNRGIYK